MGDHSCKLIELLKLPNGPGILVLVLGAHRRIDWEIGAFFKPIGLWFLRALMRAADYHASTAGNGVAPLKGGPNA